MSKITSIIVDYNSQEFTEKAIKSLLEYDGEFIDKIIVVDNFGLNNYSHILSLSKKITILIPHKNLGFGRAINLAMDYVDTPFILLQNPDTVLQSSVLPGLMDLLKDKNTAAASPFSKTPEGIEILARRFTKLHDIIAGRRSPLLKFKPVRRIGERYRYLDKLHEKNPFEVDAFTGTFVLIKKDAFIQAGGFDERYFLFMEDVDLSRKLRQKGFKIMVNPGIQITHFTGSTRKKSPLRSAYTKAKSVYLYFIKWNEIGKILQAFVGLLLGLYTIFTLFLNFLDIHRPERSWKMPLRKKH